MNLFELIDILLTPLYLLLCLTALISLISPLLKDVSSHGKTRHSEVKVHYNNMLIGSRWQHYILHDFFLVQKKFFLHFYIVGILCLVVVFLVVQQGNPNYEMQNITAVLLLIHLIRRSYECLYVHIWTEGSRMHVSGYMLGLLHYLMLPFAIVSSNHKCHGTFEDSKTTATIFIVFFINIYSQMEQYWHHCLLAKLRCRSITSTSSTNQLVTKEKKIYSIPSGRFFHFISCPHYFFEILIYISLIYSLRCNSTCDYEISSPYRFFSISNISHYKHIALLLWVITNLFISAARNHDWYISKFGNTYPTHRKRLIPYVW